MHVVTGGAYNGKSEWVKTFYKIDQDRCWVSAYKGDRLPLDLSSMRERRIVLEGVEKWIFQGLNRWDRQLGKEVIATWLSWEQACSERKIIVIGTDISKGIVPIESERRKWRDVTGWFYQDLVEACDRFDLIWYGVNQQLK